MCYFLKAANKHSFRIIMLRKAVNAGDGMVMKVPCQLLFLFAEKKVQ